MDFSVCRNLILMITILGYGLPLWGCQGEFCVALNAQDLMYQMPLLRDTLSKKKFLIGKIILHSG